MKQKANHSIFMASCELRFKMSVSTCLTFWLSFVVNGLRNLFIWLCFVPSFKPFHLLRRFKVLLAHIQPASLQHFNHKFILALLHCLSTARPLYNRSHVKFCLTLTWVIKTSPVSTIPHVFLPCRGGGACVRQ
jgi:hypothetical protein